MTVLSITLPGNIGRKNKLTALKTSTVAFVNGYVRLCKKRDIQSGGLVSMTLLICTNGISAVEI